METLIVVAIIVVILGFALKGSLKYVKRGGGCCSSGGSTVKTMKKQRLDQVVAVRHMTIEGMHCDNCRKRVENCLNGLEQVNAAVDLGKKEAVVKLGKEISDQELKAAVEKAGYTVTKVWS